MIKSRALPEGFDAMSTLRSPYLWSRPVGAVSMKAEEDDNRPAHMSCPREGRLMGSPGSVSSNPESSHAATSSVSTSEAMSPVSSRYDTPLPSDTSIPSRANSHPSKRYSRSVSFPQIYHSLSRPPNHSDLEQTSRRRAESLAIPLVPEFSFADIDWDRSSSTRSGIDQSSHECPNHHSEQSLQNCFGVSADLQIMAAQNIFVPAVQLDQCFDGLWSEYQMPASNSSSQQDIPVLCPDFGISSHSAFMTGNFDGLQASGCETVQAPSSLLMAAANGISTTNVYYPHMNSAETYPPGF